MIEPPSQELVRQLTELQLCHPSDLHRASGRVRRLAFDLPSFDSVWIDSLVQLRLLSPYQARQLEQGHADKLRIDSFVIVDELGRHPRVATYLAQRLNRRDRCVLKTLQVEPDRMDSVMSQFRKVFEQSKGFAHPQLVLPNECMQTSADQIVTVARYVPGLPLNDLLVRRGRFPAPIVFEIGRQLLEGLAALHAKSLVHGDIRMSNVRLADHGLAVLVDGAIRPAILPEITIHDQLPLDAYDGMAPELIGTAAAPNASSELYALGCLLWQLLAGRPPFPTADPLAKLASHQTKTIEDVRNWAPDTPALLAESIRQMTAPNPAERPRGFSEVLRRWRRSSSSGRARLKQFRRLFDGGVPHFVRPIHRDNLGGIMWILMAVVAIAGFGGLIIDRGMRNVLLDIANDVKTVTQRKGTVEVEPKPVITTETPPQQIARSSHGLLPLPQPHADGLILLDSDGPYEAGRLNFVGDLTIRGEIGFKPVIRVHESPLAIKARSVTFERLIISRTSESEPISLVTIRSQQLFVTNCEFRSIDFDADAHEASGLDRLTAAVAWSANDPGLKTENVEFVNCAFHGSNEAILFTQIPNSLQILNTLKTGAGAFLTLGPRCLPSDTKLLLDHVTLRDSGPLLRISGNLAEKPESASVRLEVIESVLTIASKESGLVVAETEHPRSDLEQAVEVQASDSIVLPGTELLTAYDPSRRSIRAIDIDEQFQGLSMNGVEFRGTRLYPAKESKTERLTGVSTVAAALPGIDPVKIGLGK